MLTIEKVKEIATQLYEKGGDTIIECYEDKQIKYLIEELGVDTEKKLRNFIQQGYEIDEEYRKAALWHAYGTTDEKEIAQMNASVELTRENEDKYDPCEGCQAYDGSYNCKHCKYGDDGRYESPFDVYTPAELGISVRW